MISLVIPTYNKLPRLKLTLTSIERQTMNRNEFEVILVNDASTDGTDKFLSQYRPSFNLIYCPLKENKGRSAARNEGLRRCNGNLVVFTDDDCLISDTFLEYHASAWKQGVVHHGAIWNLPYLKFFVDPSAGTLYPEFEHRNIPALLKMCVTEEDVATQFERIAQGAKKTHYEKTIQSLLRSESTYRWLSCTGGNIALEQSALEAVGGFDEQFGKAWGAEDIELGYRLYKHGMSFAYLEEAPVYHLAHYRTDTDELSILALNYMKQKHPELSAVPLYEKFFNGSFAVDQLPRLIRAGEAIG